MNSLPPLSHTRTQILHLPLFCSFPPFLFALFPALSPSHQPPPTNHPFPLSPSPFPPTPSPPLLIHTLKSILPMESEAPYVKESLSRLVVELAKQTWPQYWPSFLEDLDVLTHCGVRCVCVCVCVWGGGGGVYIPWGPGRAHTLWSTLTVNGSILISWPHFICANIHCMIVMRFAESRKKQAMPYKQHKATQHTQHVPVD